MLKGLIFGRANPGLWLKERFICFIIESVRLNQPPFKGTDLESPGLADFPLGVNAA